MDLAIQAITKRYFDFSSRARRKEYWMFVLLYIILYIIAMVIDTATGMMNEAAGIGPVSGILSLVLLIPSISVAVRRLHDIDRSGWWYLLFLIPLIGAIVLLIFFVKSGTAGDNRFGPDPKAVVA